MGLVLPLLAKLVFRVGDKAMAAPSSWEGDCKSMDDMGFKERPFMDGDVLSVLDGM
jgi:hypothetical protein